MIQAAKDHHALLMEAIKSTLLPNFKVIQDRLHEPLMTKVTSFRVNANAH
jgi:scyllo-inositol 2-dehydrogenase (NADP+)